MTDFTAVQIIAWGALAIIQWTAALLYAVADDSRDARYISLSAGFLAVLLSPALAYQGVFVDAEWSTRFVVAVFVCVWEFVFVNEYRKSGAPPSKIERFFLPGYKPHRILRSRIITIWESLETDETRADFIQQLGSILPAKTGSPAVAKNPGRKGDPVLDRLLLDILQDRVFMLSQERVGDVIRLLAERDRDRRA